MLEKKLTFPEGTNLVQLAQQLEHFAPQPLNYESLCQWVESVDWDTLDWSSSLPTIDQSDDYARNIICLKPFEMVLLHWPPGVESAVHHHEGFWGTVVVLQGVLENITYSLDSETLKLKNVLRASKNGLVPEPDGTIHKIRNGSNSEPLVTLHFYYPALESLDGLVLYDLLDGSTFVCNEEAPTASTDLPENCYRTIESNSFSFEKTAPTSHIQCNIVPKPSADEIESMVSRYFNEHAHAYDELDHQIENRRAYTQSIDQRIAKGIGALSEKRSVQRVMHLACGTGRRAEAIQRETGLDYAMHGIDMSDHMVAQSKARGIEVVKGSLRYPSSWPLQQDFDAVTLLYAYGHIPTRLGRQSAIQGAYDVLKPGGVFFFDAFDVEDENEWGPEALEQFAQQRLGMQGYEAGDLFYRRVNGKELAFLHYCRRENLHAMLEAAGFDHVEMSNIGYQESAGKESSTGKLFVAAFKPAA